MNQFLRWLVVIFIVVLLLLLSFTIVKYSYTDPVENHREELLKLRIETFKEFNNTKLMKDMIGQKLLFNQSIWTFKAQDINKVETVQRIYHDKYSITMEAKIECRKPNALLVGRVYFGYKLNEETGVYELVGIENRSANIRKEYD